MKIFTTQAGLKKHLKPFHGAGKIIGLVPTMGALHAGHMALIKYMRDRCEILVSSVFVNPTQFDNKNDLETYPRSLDSDLTILKECGCDAVFTPTVDEMYPVKESWYIDLRGLDDILEGAHRPGHFQGVTQIVKKLFDIIRPDFACFGQKDYQQIAIIRRMIEVYDLPVRLLMVSTVREPSGLALSSRNNRLSPEGKNTAANIFKILSRIPNEAEAFGIECSIQRAVERYIRIPGLKMEYLEVCQQDTLKSVKEWEPDMKYVVLTAAWVEGVRLIDNILVPQDM